MIIHYNQEDGQFLIAIYSVHNEPEENLETIEKLSGWNFDKFKSTTFSDVGELGNDTLILHKGALNDIEIYDILEEGIDIHIVS